MQVFRGSRRLNFLFDGTNRFRRNEPARTEKHKICIPNLVCFNTNFLAILDRSYQTYFRNFRPELPNKFSRNFRPELPNLFRTMINTELKPAVPRMVYLVYPQVLSRLEVPIQGSRRVTVRIGSALVRVGGEAAAPLPAILVETEPAVPSVFKSIPSTFQLPPVPK